MCDLDPALVQAKTPRPHPLVERMVRLAGARRDRSVSVTGPASLPAMIALCQMGFERVECARAATCGGADERSEVLLVSGPCAGEELAAIVGRTVRLLADGGVMVVHEASLDDDVEIERRLSQLGFDVDWKVHDLAGGALCAWRLHRRRMAVAA